MKIGNLKLDTNVIAAPLAGVSDLSYRLIMRSYGAKFCFFEMIDANSLTRSHRATISMLDTHKNDLPIGAQLLGRDPDQMLEAANVLCEIRDISIIDINAACPVRKVIAKKCGAQLLNESKTLSKVIKKLTDHLPIPVTVKLRSGFEKTDTKKLITLVKQCENSGAAAIFIHGRSREQKYSGSVDFEAIKSVKEAVSIPVLGSGNVFSVYDAKYMIEKTGCDGVLVARGAYGNPWIFKAIDELLSKNKQPKKRTTKEYITALKKHLHYIDQYNNWSPSSKIGYMRKVAQWYIKEFPSSRSMRNTITYIKDYASLLKLIDTIEM